MNKARILTLTIIALSGCTTSTEQITINKEPQQRVVSKPVIGIVGDHSLAADKAYQILPGDILSNIARRTTGDGENWREIASYNQISDPHKIQIGSTLFIPGHLLPRKTPKTAKDIKPISKPEQDVAVLVKETSDITTKPYKQRQWVMINGSYYPKAIYKQASFNGSLLTRVSPGTKLRLVSSSSSNWYLVDTHQGKGYVRSEDADILDPGELNSAASIEYQ